VTKTSASLNPPCNPSNANALQRRPAFEAAKKQARKRASIVIRFPASQGFRPDPGAFALSASRFALPASRLALIP
jgi:hypothetical protein